MSYGEPIALTDTGRAIELANEVLYTVLFGQMQDFTCTV